MMPVPLEHALLLAASLFMLGLIGLLTRRNLVFIADVHRNHAQRERAWLL